MSTNINFEDFVKGLSQGNKELDHAGLPTWFRYILAMKGIDIFVTLRKDSFFAFYDYIDGSISSINQSLEEHLLSPDKMFKNLATNVMILYLYDIVNNSMIACANLSFTADYINLEDLGTINANDKFIGTINAGCLPNCYKATGAFMMTAISILSAKLSLPLQIPSDASEGFYEQFSPYGLKLIEGTLIGTTPHDYNSLIPNQSYYEKYFPRAFNEPHLKKRIKF